MTRAGRTLLAAGLVTLAGCVELTRTNPLDVNAVTNLTITPSRDTINARNQSVTFTASAGPEFTNPQFEWALGQVTKYETRVIGGTGPTFTTQWTSSSPVVDGKMVVTAWLGVHPMEVYVPVRQVLASARFTACPRLCFGTLEDGYGAVAVTAYDSLGTAAPGVAKAEIVARAISRNTAVATPTSTSSEFRFTAKAVGNTWLVIPGTTPDSIRVYVDYRPESIQMTCPTSVAVGDQAQLATKVVGSTGVEIQAPASITWSQASLAGGGWVNLDANGFITGAKVGQTKVVTTVQIGATTPQGGNCVVNITP